jgi:HK97 family phage major capsid protein
MKGQLEIPESSEELEELLNDDGRLAEILTGGQFSDFTKAYVAAWAPKNEEMIAQMREEMQLGLQSFLRDQARDGFRPAAGWNPGQAMQLKGRDARRARAVAKSRRPDAAWQADKQALYNERAMGAAVDDEPHGETLGAFMHAVYMAERQAEKRGDTDTVAKIQAYKTKLHNALSERIPAEGGFLVPENLRSDILMMSLETAIVRPRATIVPMDSLRVPMPAIDDTSHTNNVYGGVTATWTEEGASIPDSAPAFSRVVLEARKLTAFAKIPNELLQDAVTPLDAWFNRFFPEALAWFEDVAFISGTGVAQPQGFLNAPAAVRVPVGVAHAISFTDIATAYTRMWPPSLLRSVWLCSPDALLQLLLLALTSNSTTVAPPLWLQSMSAQDYRGGGSGDGVHYTLMGRPLIVTEKSPSAGSGNTTIPGALTLVDLDKYLIGDRQTMQIATSDQYLFQNDLMAYRIIQRLDGRFWPQSAITPENGSANTLSALVKVDTTATS